MQKIPPKPHRRAEDSWRNFFPASQVGASRFEPEGLTPQAEGARFDSSSCAHSLSVTRCLLVLDFDFVEACASPLSPWIWRPPEPCSARPVIFVAPLGAASSPRPARGRGRASIWAAIGRRLSDRICCSSVDPRCSWSWSLVVGWTSAACRCSASPPARSAPLVRATGSFAGEWAPGWFEAASVNQIVIAGSNLAQRGVAGAPHALHG